MSESPFPPSVAVAQDSMKELIGVVRRFSDRAGLDSQGRVEVYRLLIKNLTVVADQLDESGNTAPS